MPDISCSPLAKKFGNPPVDQRVNLWSLVWEPDGAHPSLCVTDNQGHQGIRWSTARQRGTVLAQLVQKGHNNQSFTSSE